MLEIYNSLLTDVGFNVTNKFSHLFLNNKYCLCFRQEKNHVFLELILSALTLFSWVTVTDARGQICELGENHFPLFVQLWKYQITTIKVCI